MIWQSVSLGKQLIKMKKITTANYNFPSFCDHSQPYSEMNSADVQRESEDDMKDGQPAFKKFRHPNQQEHSTEIVKGSYDFPSQHGGDWQRFKYTRPERIYSDNVIPRAHMFLDNNEIAAHVGQPLWFDHDETQISCTALPSYTALSEEGEGDFFRKIRRYFENGRRNALCDEEIGVRVKTEPMRRETDVNLREISDQMELLVVCRKRKR